LSLTHLESLEAESIHIRRELGVADIQKEII